MNKSRQFSTYTIQYEIVVRDSANVFTNVEESAIKRFLAHPDSKLYVRSWYEGDEKMPPSDRIDISEIVRKAIAYGRGRG